MADPVLGPTVNNDVFRVTIFQRLYGQRILNTLYYRVVDIEAPAPDRWVTMGGIANAMTGVGTVLGLMKAVQSADLAHETLRVTYVKPAGLQTDPYFEIAVPDSGSNVSPAGTANVAASIEKRSTFEVGHPKQGIGRFQLAGIPNDAYEEGLFLNEYMEGLQSLADELTEDLPLLNGTARPVNGGFEDDLTFHSYFIFGASPKRTVRDMRRRTVGVGE